jgi:hypothetical protein
VEGGEGVAVATYEGTTGGLIGELLRVKRLLIGGKPAALAISVAFAATPLACSMALMPPPCLPVISALWSGFDAFTRTDQVGNERIEIDWMLPRGMVVVRNPRLTTSVVASTLK